ncbi:MAG: HlyD family secretion protein [Armatimonadota bacterium]
MKTMLLLKRYRRLITVVLLAGAVGGYGWARFHTAKAAPPSKVVAVSQRELVVKVTETGIIQPVIKVDVKSKVGGKILKLAVREGDEVKAGDLIAILDRDELQARYNQAMAQLRAAQARAAGADVGVEFQKQETSASVRQAEANLAAARARWDAAKKSLELQRSIASASLEQAKANLAAAEARLAELRAGSRPQEIEQAEENLRQARYSEAEAKRQYDRKLKLLEKGFISTSEVDAARTQWEIAQSRTQAAQKQLDLIKAGPREEEIRAAEAQVALQKAALRVAEAEQTQVAIRAEEERQARAAVRQAEANLASAKAAALQEDIRHSDLNQARATVDQLRSMVKELESQLSYTVVRSPASGTVIRRYIEEGELITSGVSSFTSGMTICTVADLRQMLVIPEINEVDVAKVRVGQPVEVRVDAVPGRIFHGVVSSIAPASTTALDPGASVGQGTVVKFRVKVRLPNPDRALRPGMSANVTIITARKQNCLCLPIDAVGERRGRKVVDVLVSEKPSSSRPLWPLGFILRSRSREPQQRFREQVVKTGLETETHVEVFGLRLGTKVRADKRSVIERKTIEIRGPENRD